MDEYNEREITAAVNESRPFNWDEELHDDVTTSNTDDIPW